MSCKNGQSILEEKDAKLLTGIERERIETSSWIFPSDTWTIAKLAIFQLSQLLVRAFLSQERF